MKPTPLKLEGLGYRTWKFHNPNFNRFQPTVFRILTVALML